ncbi:carbon-nitrogen family hydrolase [Virgibacillus alimentarius]|uniref:Amidohydrolase n=1 Tax=Virgibacillus alimentarius TaxID=698769 RepID=A0ABS4SAN5_9BACI|nr:MULTISPECIES: carbon-nitrogen family hydrolase [Virgibacillus]MBP2258166.1 putative amidohydrolase [Virgibacillus alimentarius]HLR69325.1 carbon-nitrogen family hydrolase [Virgibacillus sp.]
MKYAVYQMDIIAGNPKKNREKVNNWAKETMANEKPDVLVLPEMWTTAFTLPELDEFADVNGEPTTSFLQELAKKHHVHIIGGSIANKKDGKFYNTSVVVDRKGSIVYTYDKIHLVPMLHEHKYLTGGTEKVRTFELEGVKMGVIICYDLRFPELARKLALEGVQVLHIVAEWPAPRKDHWRHLQLARAIENQMFVVSCNRVGSYDGEDFAGTSMIIDPWGTPLEIGSDSKEETLSTTLSLDIVPKIRKDVPIFSSRVPELY